MPGESKTGPTPMETDAPNGSSGSNAGNGGAAPAKSNLNDLAKVVMGALRQSGNIDAQDALHKLLVGAAKGQTEAKEKLAAVQQSESQKNAMAVNMAKLFADAWAQMTEANGKAKVSDSERAAIEKMATQNPELASEIFNTKSAMYANNAALAAKRARGEMTADEQAWMEAQKRNAANGGHAAKQPAPSHPLYIPEKAAQRQNQQQTQDFALPDLDSIYNLPNAPAFAHPNDRFPRSSGGGASHQAPPLPAGGLDFAPTHQPRHQNSADRVGGGGYAPNRNGRLQQASPYERPASGSSSSSSSSSSVSAPAFRINNTSSRFKGVWNNLEDEAPVDRNASWFDE